MNTLKQVEIYKNILKENNGPSNRIDQAIVLSEIFDRHFQFDKIECIETGASQNFNDGCFGLFLCGLVSEYGGKFISVDIDNDILLGGLKLYHKYYMDTKVEHVLSDSVSFLQNYKGTPNLVHLDSWDLDLKNPIPSMLHGWLEFQAIKDKIPSGGICIIDDNFLKGTWVEWNTVENNVIVGKERIDINYDIIGKGSLIYHYCKNYESDWEILGNHYVAGPNVKVIIKKK